MQLIIKRKFSSSAWKAQLVTVNTGWKLTLHTWGRLKQKPGRAWKGLFFFFFIRIWEKQAGQYVKDVLLIIYGEWQVTFKQQTALCEMTQYISMTLCPCDQLPLTVLLVSLHPVWCTTDANQGFFLKNFAFSGHNKISVFQIWKFQMGNSVCPCQCDFLQTVVLSNVLSSVCINVCILK